MDANRSPRECHGRLAESIPNCVRRANASRVLRAVPIRGLSHTAWALSDQSRRKNILVAIRGIADIGSRESSDVPVVNDPKRSGSVKPPTRFQDVSASIRLGNKRTSWNKASGIDRFS